jgi:guanine nucleotide-binding protein G(I)/G(S)/G(T) subunit beta-1|tara:strand:+ start:76 stop:282 length:207 start_codon:yes stop_codon:yes gene_type:complete
MIISLSHEFDEHSSDVMSVSLSPTDENQFISGSCDALAKVWDLRQPKAAMSFKGHESDINSVAYMPDG